MPVTSEGVDGSGAYAEAMASEEADAAWIRRVALLLVGQAFSLLGSSIVQYAIWWWIVLQTRTGSAMLLATLFGVVPQAVVSIFGGVLTLPIGVYLFGQTRRRAGTVSDRGR